MYQKRSAVKLFSSVKQYLPVLIALILALTMMFEFDEPTYANESPNEQLVTGSISGVITNTDGDPVAGVVVIAYQRQELDPLTIVWTQHKSAVTGAEGQYVVELLSTGIYRLGVRDPNEVYIPRHYGNVETVEESSDIPVTGNEISDYDFVLDKGGRISGAVTDVAGVPLAGIAVNAYLRTTFDWELIEGAVTDGGGRYKFGTLQPGKYALHFAPAEPCDDTIDICEENNEEIVTYVDIYHDKAKSLADVTEIDIAPGSDVNDINAQLERAGSISGSVQVPEAFMELDIVVSVYSSDDNFQRELSRRFDSIYYGYEVVEYTLDNLRPGTYVVRAVAYDAYIYDENANFYLEYYDNTQTVDESTSISVEGGQATTNIDFLMDMPAPQAELSGTVRSNSGEPLEGIQITLIEFCPDDISDAYYDYYDYYYYDYYNYDYDCYNTPEEVGRTVTDAAGNYALDDIAPNSYTIQVTDSSSGADVSDYPMLSKNIEQVVTRRLDPAENILDITMEKGGAIIGSATTWDGRTPYDATITLYKEENSFWMPISSEAVTGDIDEEWFLAEDQFPAGPYPTALYPPGTPQSPLNGYGYAFSRLPQGSYRIGVSGYNENEPYEFFYGDTAEIENATVISVTSGAVVENIAMMIGEDNANASIEGYVTVDGDPQAGTLVDLYKYAFSDDDFDTNYDGWRLLVFTTADEQGYYRFDGLEQGEYKLRFSTPSENEIAVYYGGSYSLEEAEVVQLGADPDRVNISLNKFDTVIGTQSTEQQIIFVPISMR